MQVYGADAAEARAGECVALNLPELDHDALRRGMVLCSSDDLSAVTMAEAELRILNSVKGKVEDFLEAHLHVGTAVGPRARGDAGVHGDDCRTIANGAIAPG